MARTPFFLLASSLRVPLRTHIPLAFDRGTASSASSIHLLFERPVRRWLLESGRKQLVHVPRGCAKPMKTLRDALQSRLSADPSLFSLSHGKRHIATDEDVRSLLQLAAERDVDLLLRVTAIDEAALPPLEESLPQRELTVDEPLHMVSFFTFHTQPSSQERVAELVASLNNRLEGLNVRGSVYVASEGLNAQLAVPASHLDALRSLLDESDELRAVELNCGEVVAPSTRPFAKLVVKARRQVLTDGLESALEWQRGGVDVPPEEWDTALAEEGALLLDCRNAYESDVGHFVRPGAAGAEATGAEVAAEPLGTETFAQSWETLRSRLEHTPRDTPILTYCTGGIRCVKVNAFLEQELGFTQTKKLKDGIVGYLRHKREHQGVPTAWRGDNFVFDKRTLVPPADAASPEATDGESDEDDAASGPGAGQ